MNLEDYAQLARQTANLNPPFMTILNLRMLNWTLGICSEAGEIAEDIKHNIFHNHTLDRNNLKKEMGDLMWYLVNLMIELDISPDEVLRLNIEKLKARYPNGFSSADSINRIERMASVPGIQTSGDSM